MLLILRLVYDPRDDATCPTRYCAGSLLYQRYASTRRSDEYDTLILYQSQRHSLASCIEESNNN